ncbi:MAG: polysaccharide biosynthesis protein [Deltaproteobacteria bacterium]|nr:polysaccharide biosynthesis protein [Deltaproteobacteria bacterium]
MSDKKILIRGVLINYIQLFAAFAVNFVLTPIILNHLGRVAYGIWAVFSSIMVYFILFDIGLNTSVAKYTAEHNGPSGKGGKIDRIVSTIFVVFLFVALFITLASVVLAHFIPYVIDIPEDLLRSAKIAFVIMGVNVAIIILGGVFGNVIYGFQRVDIWKSCVIAQLLSNAILVILFLKLGFGIVGVAAASALSSLILLSLYLIFLRTGNYGISVRPGLFDLKVFKEVAPYSLRTFVLGLSSRILYYTGSIVIAVFLGAAMVAPYDIANKLCFYSTYMFSVVSTTAFPRFSKFYAEGNMEGLRGLYLKSQKISLGIMSVLAIFLFCWGRALINLWVGETNFAGMNVLALFIAMLFFHALGTPAIAMLQGIGKNKAVTWSEIVNAALNLLLSIALVKRLGIEGVVIGTLAAHLLTSFWVVQLSVYKSIGLSLKAFLAKISPTLASGLSAAILIWLIKDKLGAGSLYHLVFNGLVVAALYCVFYMAFSTKDEQLMYIEFGQRWLKTNGERILRSLARD